LFFLAGAIAHGNYGLAKDEKKAAEMALPFAQAGDAEFQFALATLYLRGESFGGHRDEGIKWLKRAANNGQPQARQMLEEFTEQKNRSHQ
jgi:TPR repeat protein